MELAEIKCSVCPHKQKWIPVSKSLPEMSDLKDDFLNEEYGNVKASIKRVLATDGKEYEIGYLFLFEDGKKEVMDIDPIAWMPLPEPYKEGDQDGRC